MNYEFQKGPGITPLKVVYSLYSILSGKRLFTKTLMSSFDHIFLRAIEI